MPACLFVSDLHGRTDRYEKLFRSVEEERPDAVFLGGDLVPHPMARSSRGRSVPDDFVGDFLVPGFDRLRRALGPSYPRVFAILGNDDPRAEEVGMLAAEARGVWEYLHGRRAEFGPYAVFGLAFVPPTPFRLKDWERYDVSRFVDPGCVSPEEGWRTVEVPESEIRLGTIRQCLIDLAGTEALDRSIFLFHTPPHGTLLDRAALDGKMVDHVPLDVHVGSIAVRRFIEERRPRVTLHGHIHESARLTGGWLDRLGDTVMLSAAHDGPELALVRFDPEDPGGATRELI